MKLQSDSGVSGRVEILTQDGKVLWDCHNLITYNGKQVFAALVAADWTNATEVEKNKELSPAYIHFGSDSWAGAELTPKVTRLKSAIDTYIPYTSVFRNMDATLITADAENIGGNTISYQFNYINGGAGALTIRELGLYTRNQTMIAYEPIAGATISAELEMTLIIRWTLTFK